jgi:hypothetical protein
MKLPYGYDYIIKLCRQRAEAIQNNENANVRNMRQGEAQHRNIEGLNLAAVTFTTSQVSKLPLQREMHKIRRNLLWKA